MSRVLFVSALLVIGGVSAQETLEDRIQMVFGGTNNSSVVTTTVPSTTTARAGFDVIVQPDPIVEVSSY